MGLNQKGVEPLVYSRKRFCSSTPLDLHVTDLAPDEHGSEDDLQAVKEVVPNDDDSSAPCGPAFTGADGFDAGGCCKIIGQNRLDAN